MFNNLVIVGLACVTLISCSGGPKPPGSQSSGEPQIATSSLQMIGFVDIPTEGATLKGEFAVGGWALWGEKVAAIQVLLDGSIIGTPSQMGVARPDVAKVHPEYQNGNSGWGTPVINTASFTPGKHRITVLAVSATGKTQEINTFMVTFVKL